MRRTENPAGEHRRVTLLKRVGDVYCSYYMWSERAGKPYLDVGAIRIPTPNRNGVVEHIRRQAKLLASRAPQLVLLLTPEGGRDVDRADGFHSILPSGRVYSRRRCS